MHQVPGIWRAHDTPQDLESQQARGLLEPLDAVAVAHWTRQRAEWAGLISKAMYRRDSIVRHVSGTAFCGIHHSYWNGNKDLDMQYSDSTACCWCAGCTFSYLTLCRRLILWFPTLGTNYLPWVKPLATMHPIEWQPLQTCPRRYGSYFVPAQNYAASMRYIQ